MDGCSKQDMRIALQQCTDLLTNRLASRQDILSAIQTISGRVCNKQEMQQMFDKNREKVMEKFTQLLQVQQYVIERLARHLEEIDENLRELNKQAIERNRLVNMANQHHYTTDYEEPYSTMPTPYGATAHGSTRY